MAWVQKKSSKAGEEHRKKWQEFRQFVVTEIYPGIKNNDAVEMDYR